MMDAHSKLEIVLNEDEENEEEKRFNEIICYDSGDSDSNEFVQSDTTAASNGETSYDFLKNLENATFDSLNLDNGTEKLGKRSNAVQMRKYRANQRKDPIRYRQYLERERMRNYKRKYERRIHEAQEKAQALGIPYVVVEPPNARRGRKPKFSGVSLVLPSNYDGFDIEDKSLWLDSDGKPTLPLDVELNESSNIKQEQNPQISVVNINKLIAHPRSALQTLLPQEVSDRERISNSIKLEHDYVMQEQLLERDRDRDRKTIKRCETKMPKRDKYETLKQRQQYKSFISRSKQSHRNHRSQRSHQNQQSQRNERNQRNRSVEHEDLDDLFKELAEVANVKPPKKHASPTKSSPGQHCTLKNPFFQEADPRSTGEFSLTVSMPVQPITSSKPKSVKIKEEPKSPTRPCNGEERDEQKDTSITNANRWKWLEKSDDTDGTNIRNSIEIKQEPLFPGDDFF